MKQPIFYPGKKLKAADLISLEDYAFSRVNIISPDHGVVNLYTNGSSPEERSDKDQNFFLLKEVNGITPSGRPVSFKAGGDRLFLKLAYPSRGVVIWDIYVDDTHPEGKGDINNDDEKYKLSNITIASPETQAPLIVPNKLYIGRYKLSSGDTPQIISPPYIYSLASFNFPSEWWQKWTYPIRQALRSIYERHKSEYIADFIKHIIYNYPFWPLSHLLRASNQLAWLCSESELENLLDEGTMADLQQSQISNPLPVSVYNIPPIEIPTKIGEILGSFGVILWKLIPAQQYIISDHLLTINKPFNGKHEIKFRFKPGEPVREYEKLLVDSFFDFIARKYEEQDNFNNVCFCYLIEYPGTTGQEKFTLKIPKDWKPDLFSIYYRTVVDK